MPKSTFVLRSGLLLALVLLRNGSPPAHFLIPATVWLKPDGLLVSRDYVGSTKSHPEWGINVSLRNQPLLDRFAFDQVVPTL